MIDKREVERAIYRRLRGLVDTLKEYGVPIAFLPNETSSYREDSSGAIRIIVDKVVGKMPSVINIPVVDLQDYDETYTVPITQELDVSVFARLSLPLRYDDEKVKYDVMSFLEQKLILSLLGYAPLSVDQVRRPLYLKSSQMMQPEGDRWIVHIYFGFSAVVSVQPTLVETYIKKVQLFATQDIELLQNNMLLMTRDIE